MENYWQWNLTKDVKRLQLKAGVVPYIFECQKKNLMPPTERTWAKKRKHMELIKEALSATTKPSPSTSNFQEEFVDILDMDVEDTKVEKSIQVNLRKPFRSRGTNTVMSVTSVACSPIKFCSDIGTCTSPTKVNNVEIEISSENPNDLSYIDFESQSESSNYNSESENYLTEKYKEHMLKGTIMTIEKQPKLFLGLPHKSFYLVKLLSEQAPLPVINIYVVLKKLRLDNPFSILAIEFGLSISTISRIFSKSLPLIAKLMHELIIWPKPKDVLANLPIPFRARYAKVVSIIDCLEIEIEKPSNPVHQALTWSNYYNCNSLKYLVSCTPDGLVNYISDGYGGRSSDLVIVEDSGYLEKLIPGVFIMADRGFKNMSTLLQQKGCTLVRPPSVSASRISTKAEVRESKRIAALRIHVERVIGRLRDFKMLRPHACVDSHLTPILDYAIIVACGIINMQDPLIKK